MTCVTWTLARPLHSQLIYDFTAEMIMQEAPLALSTSVKVTKGGLLRQTYGQTVDRGWVQRVFRITCIHLLSRIEYCTIARHQARDPSLWLSLAYAQHSVIGKPTWFSPRTRLASCHRIVCRVSGERSGIDTGLTNPLPLDAMILLGLVMWSHFHTIHWTPGLLLVSLHQQPMTRVRGVFRCISMFS